MPQTKTRKKKKTSATRGRKTAPPATTPMAQIANPFVDLPFEIIIHIVRLALGDTMDFDDRRTLRSIIQTNSRWRSACLNEKRLWSFVHLHDVDIPDLKIKRNGDCVFFQQWFSRPNGAPISLSLTFDQPGEKRPYGVHAAACRLVMGLLAEGRLTSLTVNDSSDKFWTTLVNFRSSKPAQFSASFKTLKHFNFVGQIWKPNTLRILDDMVDLESLSLEIQAGDRQRFPVCRIPPTEPIRLTKLTSFAFTFHQSNVYLFSHFAFPSLAYLQMDMPIWRPWFSRSFGWSVEDEALERVGKFMRQFDDTLTRVEIMESSVSAFFTKVMESMPASVDRLIVPERSWLGYCDDRPKGREELEGRLEVEIAVKQMKAGDRMLQWW